MVAMDKIARFELSPGSITIGTCSNCGNDNYSFLAVALSDEGVHDVGRITKCEQFSSNPSQ